MRYKLFFSTAIACLCYIMAYSQCPNVTDISNTNVCGLYGDGNGNSNWNWELNDPLDPTYCSNWYARTSPSGFLTRMGSPFVNATSGKLKVIADNGDYTKEKGWELLQRKFGCYSDITNPYFILYNRYTSMMRVYVYLGTNTSYSQLLMTIKSVYDHRPATISTANDIMYAPDKYLSNQAGTASDDIMISLNEAVGTNQWAVSEFYLMLDDHIAESVYNNGSLQITIYGVTRSSLEAVILGTTCTGINCGTPIKDAAFKSKNASTGGSSFNFTAEGEKLLNLSKSFSDFLKGIHDNAAKIANSLYPPSNYTDSTLNLLQKFGKLAKYVKDNTADSADFGQIISSVGSLFGAAGTILKFAGALIGFMKGGNKSTASPAFTNYNFKVQGTITAQVVVQSFVLKIPGTSAPPTNANNATYYSCPPGIFNLKNTPSLDTIAYERRALLPAFYNPRRVPKTISYTAYRLHDDVQVMVNAGAGLSVISVDGALMAKVDQPVNTNPDPNHVVWIGPLENYPVRGYYTYFNHMRADIEANRLEITHYDADFQTYHIIQTHYFPIECIRRANMNLNVPVMKIYLRLRATLKRTDGLGELIYFIKDYELDKQADPGQPLPPDIATNLNAIPPYSTYTISPNTNASIDPFGGNTYPENQDFEIAIFNNFTFSQPVEIKRNHTISTSSNYYTTVNCPQPLVTFRAGSSITLNPKFEATYGSVFLATVDWGDFSLPCNPSPDITNYAYSGNCYSSNIVAQRAKNEVSSLPEVKTGNIYPNPANNSLTINVEIAEKIKTIKIIDISGRVYNLPFIVSKGNLAQIDVSRLVNGSYSAIVSAGNQVMSYKFVVIR
jgi:Secretion system C-terminal sorting domain